MDVEYGGRDPGAQEGEPEPGAAEVGEGGGEDYVVLKPGTRASTIHKGKKVMCTVGDLIGPEDEFYSIRIDGEDRDVRCHYTELFEVGSDADSMRATVSSARYIRSLAARALGFEKRLRELQNQIAHSLNASMLRFEFLQEEQKQNQQVRENLAMVNDIKNKQHADMGGSKLADLRARLPSLGQQRAESAVLAEMKACLELAETRAISMEPAALEARRKHFEDLKSNLHVPITDEDQARAGMCDDCGFVAVCRCLLCFVLTRVLCRFGR